MLDIVTKIAQELSLKDYQVGKTIQLLFEEECTVPFVARYRKEMTGTLDEVQIRAVRDRFQYLSDLEETKKKYLKVIEEHCQSNPDLKSKFPGLKAKLLAAQTRQELEDLYLPFKPKRKTRAGVAKEKGLEPLLEKILDERATLNDLVAAALPFVSPADFAGDDKLRVPDAASALQGAADILAERINETAEYRALVRRISAETGILKATKVDQKDAKPEPDKMIKKKANKNPEKYENYFDYAEPLANAPSHRIMAVRRGEAEKVLRVQIEVNEDRIHRDLTDQVLGGDVATDAVKAFLTQTTEDAYRRLLSPSIETELRLELKTQAEEEAIRVFARNLEKLLLLPPIPGTVVMGVDPGLRTGSKLAVVDETGKPLVTETIHPDYKKVDSDKSKRARDTVLKLLRDHKVSCIAIGNGTGSREIDQFITSAAKEADLKVSRVIVNEAGASVYSTDDIAREEFPDLDATLRSAISIARRLQDPLAELVKINPRSIGVGQYQHDVNPNKLGRSLEEVVESCVNKVGVNLNTASYKLLGYVSGVGPMLAKSIVTMRNDKGKFLTRKDLLTVSGLGPKAFQQAAGFVRVPGSADPLDNSAVHPERYDIVQTIVKDLGRDVKDIIGVREIVEAIPLEKYVTEAVGLPTLRDIAAELVKPGRDPREDGSRLMFSDDVSDINDLNEGMKLKGTVTNVTNFGAFVDIGVHQDGLVHISELSNEFVKDPNLVVAVGDILDITVIGVDKERRRISLSCRTEPAPAAQRAASEQKGASAGPGGDRSRGGPNRPRPAGGGQRPRPQDRQGHGQGQANKRREPEKQHSLSDLLNKFKR